MMGPNKNVPPKKGFRRTYLFGKGATVVGAAWKQNRELGDFGELQKGMVPCSKLLKHKKPMGNLGN